MMPPRVLPILALLLAIPGVASAAEWVLPPAAGEALGAALRLSEPFAGKHILRAELQKSRVVVRAGNDESAQPALHVTLVHPDGAPRGAPRVAGIALLPEPGPAPKALVAELLRRLRAAKQPVPWVDAASSQRADGTTARRRPSTLDLARLEDLLRSGQHDEARTLLEALPDHADVFDVLDAAVAWVRMDQQGRAVTLLKRIPAPALHVHAAMEAVRGHGPSAKKLLTGASESGEVCALTLAAAILAKIGNDRPKALELARGIRTRDGDCADAWALELELLVTSRSLDEALKVAEQAEARHKDHEGVLSHAASVYRVKGRLDRAIEIHETLAREDPKRPGRLANLLAVALIRVGEPGGTERLRTRLDAELKKRPNDLVARFLLGVLHHYRNEFDRSNALLGPLERTLGGEPRFHVYLAMNDFNLGRRAPALDRLNRAMKLSTIDPDVYYCRAEILRDSDRPQALADLRLYATMSTASALHNKEKEQKVRRMIASLEACEKAGTGVCPGPWEHPRATMQKHEGAP